MLCKLQGLSPYEIAELWHSVHCPLLRCHTHSDCPFIRGNVITNVREERSLATKSPADIALRITGDICEKCSPLSLPLLASHLLMLSLSSTGLTLPSLLPLRDNLLKIFHSFFINQSNTFYFQGNFKPLFNPQLCHIPTEGLE